MSYNAIVLIGEHNTGKDTIGQYLCSIVKDSGIIKFGGLAKYLVARMFGLDMTDIEDKEKREEKLFYDLSPLTVLNLLFQAGQLKTPEAKSLRKSYCDNAMNYASMFSMPIFTDIRRQEELDEVKSKYNPLVFTLFSSDGFLGAPGDEEVEQLFMDNTGSLVYTVGYYTPEESCEFVRKSIEKAGIVTKEKPKIYLVDEVVVVPGTQMYYLKSFSEMFDKCGGLLSTLSGSTMLAMVEAFLRNANASEAKSYLGLHESKSYTMPKNDVVLLLINHMTKTHDVYIQCNEQGDETKFKKYRGN